MPFQTWSAERSRRAFTGSPGQLLSDRLGAIPEMLMISHYAMQQEDPKTMAIKGIASKCNTHYVIAGNVEFNAGNIGISVQLINAVTEIQIRSLRHDFKSGTDK